MERRELQVYESDEDWNILELKKNKDGEIKKLNRIIINHVFSQDTIISVGNSILEKTSMIEEDYVKGKYWVLWNKEGVLDDKKKRNTTYVYLLDGMQFGFNEDGRIIYKAEYELGIRKGPVIGVKYYPNGNLKIVAELNGNTYWNILSHKYPNGDSYDFGDFKNGKGSIEHLNDDGKPCMKGMHKRKRYGWQIYEDLFSTLISVKLIQVN